MKIEYLLPSLKCYLGNFYPRFPQTKNPPLNQIRGGFGGGEEKMKYVPFSLIITKCVPALAKSIHPPDIK